MPSSSLFLLGQASTAFSGGAIGALSHIGWAAKAVLVVTALKSADDVSSREGKELKGLKKQAKRPKSQPPAQKVLRNIKSPRPCRGGRDENPGENRDPEPRFVQLRGEEPEDLVSVRQAREDAG